MKKVLFAFVIGLIMLSSCSVTNQSMREPNARVEFVKSDFAFSEQVAGTATSTKILGIDWARLFKSEGANVIKDGAMTIPSLASIPVVGTMLADPTANYALYDMMNKNQGYDVVFYPQYVTKVDKPIGIGFIYSVTTVEVKAKLGKIK